MRTKKPLWLSKTFWGSIITALGVFFPEVTKLKDPQVYQALVTIGGVLLTIYGRFKANTDISGLFK